MTTNQNGSNNFAIFEGGILNSTLAKFSLEDSKIKLAALGISIVWLPLVLISAFEGTLLSSVQMPFLYDVAMHARLLIAVPMMLIIKNYINYCVIEVTKQTVHELINSHEHDLFITKVFQRARKYINSPFTTIIILLIIIASTIGMVKGGVYSALDIGKSSWMASMAEAGQQLSWAGYWSVFISIPLTQYILLQWLWRYIVWVLVLFKISQTNLDLLPTHADKSGGLGIFMVAQKSFSLIFVAIGIILSGQLIAMILNDPDTFNTVRGVALGFITISILLLISPLVFFFKKLYKTKSDGLLNLSNLSTGLSKKFEHEWVNSISTDKILEEKQIDPSLIYDYNGIYSSLEELRLVPVTVRDIIGISGLLFLPFVPIIFIHFSLGELMQKIAGMVL